MARLSIDFPSIAASFSQNVSRLAVEKTFSGQRLTGSWLETTCEKLAWEATGQAASVIAKLFQGTGSFEVLHRFPAWLHLESQEFWQKALYIELAGECHDLAPMSRSSQSPNIKGCPPLRYEKDKPLFNHGLLVFLELPNKCFEFARLFPYFILKRVS